mgnify:CR=1 FL=1
MQTIRILLLIAVVITCGIQTNAQVTIGRDESSVQGALLQLKTKKDNSSTGEENAYQGLGLPRVMLNSSTVIASDNNDLKATIDNTSGAKWEKEIHVGLMVYNLSEKTGRDGADLCPGVYVWNGTKWARIPKACAASYKCGDNDLTVEQWAERIGFSPAEIANVTNAEAGSSIERTGYQLHRDQGTDGKGANGKLFISSDFGTAGRWMITNLAARSFADAAGRKSYDKTIVQSLPATPTSSTAIQHVNALWAYPKTMTDPTTYNSYPRQGLVYNWIAATNSKGHKNSSGTASANGLGSWNDGEHQANARTYEFQGICPNGWHLPSDAEYADLEQVMCDNTTQYAATLPKDGSTIAPNAFVRGAIIGTAMKDPCPTPGQTSPIKDSNGASNMMSSGVKSGFNVILTGIYNYGSSANMWTASSSQFNMGWNRVFGSAMEPVSRASDPRSSFASVRCKKN